MLVYPVTKPFDIIDIMYLECNNAKFQNCYMKPNSTGCLDILATNDIVLGAHQTEIIPTGFR